MAKRRAGVLMHITSLPSRFGIGGFGAEAKRWIDFLAENGFRIWQVLPFHPIDEMNSPYKSESAFAGNFLFIDPAALCDAGDVTPAELAQCEYTGSPYTADYDFARRQKEWLLRCAFARADETKKAAVEAFAQAHPWAADYALFKAVKTHCGDAPWWEWDASLRSYQTCRLHTEQFKQEMEFQLFVQYVFFTQWHALRQYAAARGVQILGDMPVYVAMDSADVWSHTEQFQMQPDTFVPKEIAGVPPDYFSEEGQLWGNPIYDWTRMEQDGFRWWQDRLRAELELYDLLRIDHFRGLASYWSVPYGSKTAIHGQWKPGPGMRLFRALETVCPKERLIAEDLGAFGEDVVRLLDETGLPGIRVIQFGFDGSAENVHLPHNYTANTVACLGTHDNNTLLGWLFALEDGTRRHVLEYCGFDHGDWGEGGYHAPACRKLIETVWRSAADTVIIAFQDLCGFGSDARMNIPGVAEKNWRFRTTQETIDGIDTAYYKKINAMFGR